MLKTNGPVKDYSRYVLSSTPRYLRPLSDSEITDSALHLYRQQFFKLASHLLVPSLYVSGFAVVFFRLIFPRLFETKYAGNTNFQVIEFGVLLLGGLMIGSFVANIGLAKISSVCFEAAKAEIMGEEVHPNEIEFRSRSHQKQAYKTLFRAIWYVAGISLISIVPLMVSGFLLTVTKDSNVLPALIGIFSVISIPISLLFICIRIGVGMGIVITSLAESLNGQAATARAQYLFGPKSRPIPKKNPSVEGAVVTLLLYLFLRAGLYSLDSTLEIRDRLLDIIPFPLLKVGVDTAVGILPEFLVIWLALPYLAMSASLHYFQRRIAVEGLDIEVMSENLRSNRR